MRKTMNMTVDVHQSLIEEWLSKPLRSRVFFLVLFALSVFAVFIFSFCVAASEDWFPTGPLSAGQIMVLVLCTFTIICVIVDTVDVCILRVDGLYLTKESRAVLRAGAEFSTYLLLMFVCDRTSLFPRMKKWYTADSFWFLWLSLVLISLCTLTKAKPPQSLVVASGEPTLTYFHVPPLAREQTEEWKGWMQVLFLWYHYFHNVSIYNSIRLFIAAYVWMTGFGNFSYYYVRKDFSLSRFSEMQWRLNFLVTVVCLLLGNQYMLYYICPLHTLFTLIIYGSLYCGQAINYSRFGLLIKMFALLGVCFLLWDVSEKLFYVLWTPFNWLLRYDDPYKPKREVMSEWYFRTFLDHYIWIYGMLCAYFHPNFDAFLRYLDEMQRPLSWATKWMIVFLTLLVGYIYTVKVYFLPKYEYNAVHPYTSFIPVTLYIILRNIFMCARMYHIKLFSSLGKVTLESYISQFHVWMLTTGLNGNPRELLRVLPENYPLINFALTSMLLCLVSFRLFATTNATRVVLLPPHAPTSVLRKNLLTAALFGMFLFSISYGIRSVVA